MAHYFVTKSGVVVSKRYGDLRVISPRILKNGYAYVSLSTESGRVHKSIHSLVVNAFGGRKTGTEINHINGIKTDNRISNLEWSTRSKNSFHKCRVLGLCSGENHYKTKLKKADVIKIKRLLKLKKMSQPKIGSLFGVSEDVVGMIDRGVTWKSIK